MIICLLLMSFIIGGMFAMAEDANTAETVVIVCTFVSVWVWAIVFGKDFD